MEGEVIDYTFLLNNIIDRLDEIIFILEGIQSSIVPIISGIWTFVTIIVPLVGVVVALWWFFKQFLYRY